MTDTLLDSRNSKHHGQIELWRHVSELGIFYSVETMEAGPSLFADESETAVRRFFRYLSTR